LKEEVTSIKAFPQQSPEMTETDGLANFKDEIS
jgi:hypothetical protein